MGAGYRRASSWQHGWFWEGEELEQMTFQGLFQLREFSDKYIYIFFLIKVNLHKEWQITSSHKISF